VAGVVSGGDTRQQSVWYGLKACSEDTAIVVIHEAARPLVTPKVIEDIVVGLSDAESTAAVTNATDTIIRATPSCEFAQDIPNRSTLFREQCPQGFHFDSIKRAHEMAREEKCDGATDDCGLILRYKLGRVRLIPGDEENLKITYPIDVYIADRLMQIRSQRLKSKSSVELQSSLCGKTLGVFGGGSGIGKATAEIASGLGMHVRAWGSEVDVRDYDAVRRTLLDLHAEKGRIDHVINSAGVLRMAYVELADAKLIAEQIAVNLLGSVNVCKAAVDLLRESHGHIVLFASNSYTRGRAGYTAYSASKAGVVNFAQGFADEVSDDGVKVNCLKPGRTKTPMREQNFGNEEEDLLLKPETVAIQCLNVLTTSLTGSVIDVRKKDEREILSTFGASVQVGEAG